MHRRGYGTYYRSGDWNIICDDCGTKRKASDVRAKWNGMIVCADTCYEYRNPQDFVRAKNDRQRVPFARPEAVGGIAIDVFNITIDDTDIPIDQQGDIFLDVNEVQSSDL